MPVCYIDNCWLNGSCKKNGLLLSSFPSTQCTKSPNAVAMFIQHCCNKYPHKKTYNSPKVLAERGTVAEKSGRPSLSGDAECSIDCNTLDAMASTEGEPIEDEEDGLRGVLEEDCAIQPLPTKFNKLKTELAKISLSASWSLCDIQSGSSN